MCYAPRQRLPAVTVCAMLPARALPGVRRDPFTMRTQIRRSWGWVVAALFGALSAAHAADANQDQKRSQQITQSTVQALLAARDADSLAAAAEISDQRQDHGAQRFALLTQAVRLAPGRADLVWLQIAACVNLDSCDPSPLVATLHRLDPEDGATWGPLLDRAVKRGDEQATTHYLDEIGNSKRFDLYWNEFVSHLTTAATRTGAMTVRAALVSVMGIGAAVAIPAFRNIEDACKPPESNRIDRHDVCRGIMAALRAGDTYITEMIGAGLAMGLWPKDSAEYTDALAARRVAQYRIQVEGDLDAGLSTEAGARHFLGLLSTHRAEQEAVLALIVDAGKNPNPPPGWQAVPPGR